MVGKKTKSSEMRALILSCGTWVAIATGCGDAPPRVAPPEVSPQKAGDAAMAIYDSDGNGQINGPELKNAPAMVAALDRIDTNADGSVSVDEVSQRIRIWQSASVGRAAIACKVTLNGAPLASATVTLRPEPFLGDDMHPATGTTDTHGVASLSVVSENREDGRLLGVPYGLYTVHITKSVSGRELVPARYNRNTILGCEVARDANLSTGGILEFRLTGAN